MSTSGPASTSPAAAAVAAVFGTAEPLEAILLQADMFDVFRAQRVYDQQQTASPCDHQDAATHAKTPTYVASDNRPARTPIPRSPLLLTHPLEGARFLSSGSRSLNLAVHARPRIHSFHFVRNPDRARLKARNAFPQPGNST
ncbi:uncharacterized protein MYCFIDRAFT_81476 [Pseudocercospora fijiensis CIRAD86]|uniref:Uncharacterized protein n=1 Tax=Pseudocercospora fijiensis (strain CIRAD86) TaxID=383855 RepID=M3AVB0_PSEFD|nr:uncharacterized protein MYCFIDRAFT_81476 [Pseudocercospora fijiensis CIRAD86]EME81422.1 hypothetical protein MYCFIDRAFT_81476 [Pseudocercospora fijiensis CIRAD86]